MPLLRLSALLLLVLATSACSTKAYFKLPENSTISINQRPQAYSQGLVTVRPFFWNRAGGVPYKLRSATDATLAEGKLATRFRVVSIFWPPYSIIYWPMGFRHNCYDLSSATAAPCSAESLALLRNQAAAKE